MSTAKDIKRARKQRAALKRKYAEISARIERVHRQSKRLLVQRAFPCAPTPELTPNDHSDINKKYKTSINEALSKNCKKIISQLMENSRLSFPFNAPVDTERYTTYLDKVSSPMDFGTIRSKLDEGKYPSVDAFKSDVMLVFENARTFNPPGSDVHVMAEALQSEFLKLARESLLKVVNTAEANKKRDNEARKAEKYQQSVSAFKTSAEAGLHTFIKVLDDCMFVLREVMQSSAAMTTSQMPSPQDIAKLADDVNALPLKYQRILLQLLDNGTGELKLPLSPDDLSKGRSCLLLLQAESLLERCRVAAGAESNPAAAAAAPSEAQAKSAEATLEVAISTTEAAVKDSAPAALTTPASAPSPAERTPSPRHASAPAGLETAQTACSAAADVVSGSAVSDAVLQAAGSATDQTKDALVDLPVGMAHMDTTDEHSRHPGGGTGTETGSVLKRLNLASRAKPNAASTPQTPARDDAAGAGNDPGRMAAAGAAAGGDASCVQATPASLPAIKISSAPSVDAPPDDCPIIQSLDTVYKGGFAKLAPPSSSPKFSLPDAGDLKGSFSDSLHEAFVLWPNLPVGIGLKHVHINIDDVRHRMARSFVATRNVSVETGVVVRVTNDPKSNVPLRRSTNLDLALHLHRSIVPNLPSSPSKRAAPAAGGMDPEELQHFAIQALAVPDPKNTPIPHRMPVIPQGAMPPEQPTKPATASTKVDVPDPFSPVPASKRWKTASDRRQFRAQEHPKPLPAHTHHTYSLPAGSHSWGTPGRGTLPDMPATPSRPPTSGPIPMMSPVMPSCSSTPHSSGSPSSRHLVSMKTVQAAMANVKDLSRQHLQQSSSPSRQRPGLSHTLSQHLDQQMYSPRMQDSHMDIDHVPLAPKASQGSSPTVIDKNDISALEALVYSPDATRVPSPTRQQPVQAQTASSSDPKPSSHVSHAASTSVPAAAPPEGGGS